MAGQVDATKRERAIRRHAYINAFLEIIKKSPMTVNYNFYDTLEKLLMFSRSPEEIVTTRGYETNLSSEFAVSEGKRSHLSS